MDLLIIFSSALWLRIVASISPCPLGTNIAVISFLSKRVAHPMFVFISAISYIIGRMLSYAVLGFLIINSLLSVPPVAMFLQTYMGKVIGPVLIITGLVFLNIIKFHIPSLLIPRKYYSKFTALGIFGSSALGVVIALAFCPISAALFFGSLIPLALQNDLGIVMPIIYGKGTGLPVMICALVIALGIASLSHWFRRLTKIEYYMRRITGAIFILIGLYYINAYFLKFF